MRIFVIVFLHLIVVNSTLRFLVLGDWGSYDSPDYYQTQQA
jgi:hypothetical protein